jgi:hypothetical protein
MSTETQQTLTLARLKTYKGFENLNNKELRQAIAFIEQMAEVIVTLPNLE